MYILVWQDEVIDSFDSEQEARAMQAEYNLAYGGGVTVEYEDEDDGQPSWEQEWEDFGEDGGYEMDYL